jgi:hypothetical protein
MKPGPGREALVILAATVRKLGRAKPPEGVRAGDFRDTVILCQAE